MYFSIKRATETEIDLPTCRPKGPLVFLGFNPTLSSFTSSLASIMHEFIGVYSVLVCACGSVLWVPTVANVFKVDGVSQRVLVMSFGSQIDNPC